MSNARCLTEGVDVPAVDMVAFLSPRRSLVDIVQATGRAMRRSPGKTTGYVLVPLYLEQATGERIEDAVNRAEFDEVWDVLQSLQEQDDVLAEIIRAICEQKGKAKGFDDSRFQERVEILGPQISLESIRRAITSACIEQLGSFWDERFGELQAFKNQYGHCIVPARWPQNKQLGMWVSNQRLLARNLKLGKERHKRLGDLGFVWNPFEADWEGFFSALKKYKTKHGNCLVSDAFKENEPLGKWVSRQRVARKRGELTQARIERLNEIGFIWDIFQSNLEEMFSMLARYKEVHGNCNVPFQSSQNRRLGAWIANQRRLKEKGRLAAQIENRLADIGLDWNPRQTAWNGGLKKLIEYKSKHGDCDVPQKCSEGFEWLGTWVLPRRRG